MKEGKNNERPLTISRRCLYDETSVNYLLLPTKEAAWHDEVMGYIFGVPSGISIAGYTVLDML
jgi:hypothetical protein